MNQQAKDMGVLIKKLRRKLGLSQTQLAKKLKDTGFCQSEISALECGYRKALNMNKLERLAKELQVRVEELRKYMPDISAAQSVQSRGQFREAKKSQDKGDDQSLQQRAQELWHKKPKRKKLKGKR